MVGLVVGAAWLGAAWPAGASAQDDPAVVYDTFSAALDDGGFISLPGTVTPGHLRSALTVGVDWSFDQRQPGGVQRGAGHLSRRTRGAVSAEVGIGSRLAVAFTFPVVFAQVGEREPAPTEAGSAIALAPREMADVRAQARYRVFGSVADRTGVRADGPGLGLQLAVDLPAGDAPAYTGEAMTRTELSLLGDFQVLGAGIGAQIGWLHRPESRVAGDITLRDSFVYGVGARVPMPFLPSLSALLELRGQTDFVQAQATPLEGLLGARLQLKPWTLSLAGGLQLATAYGAPEGRLLVAVRVTPEDPDKDGDGIPDERDECPLLPEDLDGFRDQDGCEDPDNDNDLIPDVDDLCPNEEALVDRDADEDGCTDPVR